MFVMLLRPKWLKVYWDKWFRICQSWSKLSARCCRCCFWLHLIRGSTNLNSTEVAVINFCQFPEKRQLDSDENVSRHLTFNQTVHKSLDKLFWRYDVPLNPNLHTIIFFLKPDVISPQELSSLTLDNVLICEAFRKDIFADGYLILGDAPFEWNSWVDQGKVLFSVDMGNLRLLLSFENVAHSLQIYCIEVLMIINWVLDFLIRLKRLINLGI